MTEYNAVCNASSRDVITALAGADVVELVARSHGDRKMETFLSAEKARTFARGILALADEVDGGEGPAVARPKVGNRVRVVKDDPITRTGRFVGLVGTLTEDNGPNDRTPFLVTFGPGRHGETTGQWYCAEVEVADEPETAVVDKPTVRGIKVGDKVRILVDGAECAEVLRGDVFTVSRVGGTLIVVDYEEDGETENWYFRDADSLEKVVDEPEASPSHAARLVQVPSRAALLGQARDLMSGSSTYSAYDLTELADYLAGDEA